MTDLTNNQAEHLVIYTDGACTKNPGGSGGYGAVLIIDKNNPVKLNGYIPSPTTSNRAELMAVIFAIFHAQALGYKRLHIHSDSKYVVNTINGQYRIYKNKDLWSLLNLATSTLSSLRCNWIKGHNGNQYNEMADKLAVSACKLYLEQEEIKPSGINVTDIGMKLKPKMTAIDLNKLLIKLGYQIKNIDNTYSPTAKGQPFAIVDNYINSEGFKYSRLTWLYELANEVQQYLNNLT